MKGNENAVIMRDLKKVKSSDFHDFGWIGLGKRADSTKAG